MNLILVITFTFIYSCMVSKQGTPGYGCLKSVLSWVSVFVCLLPAYVEYMNTFLKGGSC